MGAICTPSATDAPSRGESWSAAREALLPAGLRERPTRCANPKCARDVPPGDWRRKYCRRACWADHIATRRARAERLAEALEDWTRLRDRADPEIRRFAEEALDFVARATRADLEEDRAAREAAERTRAAREAAP